MRFRTILVMLGFSLLVAAGILWDADNAAGQDTPTPGIWQGTAEFEADSGLGAAEMVFEVDAAGQVNNGAVILQFSYPTMSAEMLDLMLQYGCVVSFDAITPDSVPVAGSFTSDEQASGTFVAAGCSLQDYGDLQFLEAVAGTWSAVYAGAAEETTAPDDSAKPTRVPTLDPNQPTAMPTRVPTLDPNMPTQAPEKPTRVPTLDPNQPTAAPVLSQPEPTATTASGPDTAAASTEVADSSGGNDLETEGSTSVIITTGDDYPYDPAGDHVTYAMSARKMYKEYCEECHGQQGIGTEEAPELEALNAVKIAETVRDGPEDMDVFTHEDIPDRSLNALIDYVLLFHPDSEPRPGTVITNPTTK